MAKKKSNVMTKEEFRERLLQDQERRRMREERDHDYDYNCYVFDAGMRMKNRIRTGYGKTW